MTRQHCLPLLAAVAIVATVRAEDGGYSPDSIFGPSTNTAPIQLVAARVDAPPPAAPAATDAPAPMPMDPAPMDVPETPHPNDLPSDGPMPTDGPPVPAEGVDAAPCVDGGCETGPCTGDVACDEPQGWLDRQEPLLAKYRNVPLFPDSCDSTWYYSIGGEFRYRYMDERNRLRPQGNVRPSTYHLTRFTPFLEVGNEWIKGHAQIIDAEITGNDIPITPIDRNRWDMLQYYLDLKVGEFDGGVLRYRYGRQLLKFGDQHLISPLGWANTFRNFEGHRLYYSDDVWDVDGFAVQSVNGAAGGIFRPEQFDQKDESRWLSGVYATYKNAPKGTFDLFWVWFNENEPNPQRQDGDRHTIGARYNGSHAVTECDQTLHTYLWDVSGGYQFGRDNFGGVGQDVRAGYLAAIAGVRLDRYDWKPTVQGIFWWGSGDDTPGTGTNSTYNSLYPLGHAYWGLIDNHNGQNLLDYGVMASVKPMKKVTFLTAWHWFEKEAANDRIYNIVGAPLGPAGTDGNIGNELDLVCTYQANPNLQVQAGYFMYWYGDAVNNTALNRPDAKQFYLMTTIGF